MYSKLGQNYYLVSYYVYVQSIGTFLLTYSSKLNWVLIALELDHV